MNAEILNQYFEARLPAYLDLLESWVSVNSFTENRDGVNRLGEATIRAFEPLGFRGERTPSRKSEYGDHFVLTRPGAGNLTIGLVSHLDTVFPAQEEAEHGFHWRVEGDRAYGPGTVDIKGGTLGILMVLEALREFDPGSFEAVTWIIMLDASEESLSEDFGRLCLERLDGAAACLVFEGGFYDEGVFKLVQMRKGMAKFVIRVEGKAAHAGVAHANGANAIVRLSETITQISALTDYARGLTVNVGVASGGTVPNRVPHFAEALGEMRAFEMDVFEEALRGLESLSAPGDTAANGSAACGVSVEILDITQPWPRNPETDRLIEIWARQAEALGWRILPEARGGLSDGNHTWAAIPTLDGLGPSGGNAHCSVHEPESGKEQEYITLSSILPKAVLNTLSIRGLIESAVVGN